MQSLSCEVSAPETPATAPRLPADPRLQAKVRRFRLLLAATLLAWLGGELAAHFGISLSPLYLALVNLVTIGHFPIALASIFILYVSSGPDSRDLMWASVVALVIGIGWKVLLPRVGEVAFDERAWDPPLVYSLCVGLGAAAILMMARRAWLSTGVARTQVLVLLLPACLLVAFVPIIFFFLILTCQLNAPPLDALVYAADGTLGLQPSFALGRVFMSIPGLEAVAGLVYCTLPMEFLIILLLQLRSYPPPLLDILPPFSFIAVTGFCIYLIFPVVGPRFGIDQDFPHNPPTVAEARAHPGTVSKEVPRNSMPSLHTAWALLMWWQARGLGRWVRVMAGTYLLLTLLATLGFGAHYAFDVIVAFPYTLAAQAVCLPPCRPIFRLRLGVFLGAVMGTIGWLVLLRFGLPLLEISPVVTAAAALWTAAGTMLLEHRLYRALAANVRDDRPGAAAIPDISAA